MWEEIGGKIMTYEESYMQFDNVDDLLKEIGRDIEVALLINPDRIPVIKRMAEKVLNLKFKDADINWEG